MKKSASMLAGILMFATAAAGETVAISGPTLYDGTGRPPLEDAVIVIEDGEVECVGTIEQCPIPSGIETIDMTGRFVTPGLIDGHVHYAQTGWLDGRPDSGIATDYYDYEALQASLRADPDRWHHAYLCSGVTAVFDPGGLPWTLELEEEAEGDPERPHLVAAGPLMTHYEQIFPVLQALDTNTFLPMGSDEEALASVRQLAMLGARAVKVWYLDPPEGEREALDSRLVRIGEAAAEAGLPLIVHATELRNAKVALRAGAWMLVHSVWDQPVDEEFLRLARESGAFYAPTLIVGSNWRRAVASVTLGVAAPPIDDPNGCVDAETRRVIAEAPRLSMRGTDREESPEVSAETTGAAFSGLESAARRATIAALNLARVYQAGIPIVTSTDAGNPLTVHGPSIYREMEAMEAAGLPPEDVLVMSTRNGAAMMGRLDDFGTVEAGKLADLIVLTEDPGDSTSAFRAITHVMRRGVLHEIEELASD